MINNTKITTAKYLYIIIKSITTIGGHHVNDDDDDVRPRGMLQGEEVLQVLVDRSQFDCVNHDQLFFYR